MNLTREEVEALTAYLSKQFIDRSDNHLYNGEVIHVWLKKAEAFLEYTLLSVPNEVNNHLEDEEISRSLELAEEFYNCAGNPNANSNIKE